MRAELDGCALRIVRFEFSRRGRLDLRAKRRSSHGGQTKDAATYSTTSEHQPASLGYPPASLRSLTWQALFAPELFQQIVLSLVNLGIHAVPMPGRVAVVAEKLWVVLQQYV